MMLKIVLFIRMFFRMYMDVKLRDLGWWLFAVGSGRRMEWGYGIRWNYIVKGIYC